MSVFQAVYNFFPVKVWLPIEPWISLLNRQFIHCARALRRIVLCSRRVVKSTGLFSTNACRTMRLALCLVFDTVATSPSFALYTYKSQSGTPTIQCTPQVRTSWVLGSQLVKVQVPSVFLLSVPHRWPSCAKFVASLGCGPKLPLSVVINPASQWPSSPCSILDYSHQHYALQVDCQAFGRDVQTVVIFSPGYSPGAVAPGLTKTWLQDCKTASRPQADSDVN